MVAEPGPLHMSAVCYLFGLNIHKARSVPVGLINSNHCCNSTPAS